MKYDKSVSKLFKGKMICADGTNISQLFESSLLRYNLHTINAPILRVEFNEF